MVVSKIKGSCLITVGEKVWIISVGDSIDKLCFCLDSEESFLVLTEFPCVVLWRPEALDCRVLIPPEALELAYP